MNATADTRTQIERAIANVLEEVPALAPLKLVFTLVLRGAATYSSSASSSPVRRSARRSRTTRG